MKLLVRAALVGATVAALAGCSSTPEIAPTPTSSGDPSLLSQVSRLDVVGDSISIGVNACDTVGPCPELSWATGSDPAVRSVASRLREIAEAELEVGNRAREGARIADAVESVDAVVADQPDLVLVLIGANDACAPDVASVTSAADFDASASRLVSELSSGLPQATILVMSVPDLNQIREANRGNDAAVRTWSRSPACRSLLLEAQSDAPEHQARRATIANLVDDYNASLARACAATPKCLTDGGAAHEIAFGADDLSTLDYFHPSAAAQARMAQIAWDALAAAD